MRSDVLSITRKMYEVCNCFKPLSKTNKNITTFQ